MLPLDSISIKCVCAAEIWRAIGEVNPMIPEPERTSFRRIRSSLFAQFGIDGLFERLNGKSIATILHEYQSLEEQIEVARSQLTCSSELKSNSSINAIGLPASSIVLPKNTQSEISETTFRQRYASLFSRIGFPLGVHSGVSNDLLQEAAEKLGIECPLALADYYAVAGKENALNHALNQIVRPSDWIVSDGKLIFMEENQKAFVWGAELNGLADPPVSQRLFIRGEGKWRWHAEHDSCSQFLEVLLVYQCVNGGMPHCDRSELRSSDVNQFLEHGWETIGTVNMQTAFIRQDQCLFLTSSKGLPLAIFGAQTKDGIQLISEEVAANNSGSGNL